MKQRFSKEEHKEEEEEEEEKKEEETPADAVGKAAGGLGLSLESRRCERREVGGKKAGRKKARDDGLHSFIYVLGRAYFLFIQQRATHGKRRHRIA